MKTDRRAERGKCSTSSALRSLRSVVRGFSKSVNIMTTPSISVQKELTGRLGLFTHVMFSSYIVVL
jgi:hypothetical protein